MPGAPRGEKVPECRRLPVGRSRPVGRGSPSTFETRRGLGAQARVLEEPRRQDSELRLWTQKAQLQAQFSDGPWNQGQVA